MLKALGLTGIDKSSVSRVCKELDHTVEEFRNRPLQESYPYVWLDAMYLKVRQNHRVVSLALVIATGVDDTGERHMLGFDLGASEDEEFWLAFLRSLINRGFRSVQLVISDGHEGLKKALSQVYTGEILRKAQDKAGSGVGCTSCAMCWRISPDGIKERWLMRYHRHANAIRMIFNQPDRYSAGLQLHGLAQSLGDLYPQAAKFLVEAEEDILVYKTFPREHWRRIHSTNPLERLNKEVKRRT